MFKLNLKDENILMKITVKKIVTKKDVVTNFVGNLLTAAGGDIADKVHLILTKDVLYLEYIGHTSIGYVEETRKIEKILLSDLKNFTVISKKNEELIEINTNNDKFLFVRDNTSGNGLGLAMSKLIHDIN
ncbi:hypothetical protein PMY38_18825 [Clostridium tertium]|uniref:hypothetical protein n=1 Tax=Clostridium tertium TaxID=1559 RepID=UPI000C07ECB7|nr:hypothetical protein [Clostridium tertium]MDB1956010.1 hypothetical protein [Clostridium tertium]MDB1960644.1 hypothetical protein [Clostridium tertium]MDB1962082.1 hypothetical protein [Clostridium tertium]MDB1967155.1 hypothetical protein [Clostridium tertium]